MIPGNTPLLISKPSMARLGIVLDTAHNRIRVESLDGPDGKWRDVPVAQSGHLLLPIDHLFLERDSKIDEAMVVSGMKPPAWRSKRAIMAAMTKLHKQFGHAPIRNVVSLVKASQVNVYPNMLVEVASNTLIPSSRCCRRGRE